MPPNLPPGGRTWSRTPSAAIREPAANEQVPESHVGVGEPLDAGAAGLLVPQVNTPEEAAEVVRDGRKGFDDVHDASPGSSARMARATTAASQAPPSRLAPAFSR